MCCRKATSTLVPLCVNHVRPDLCPLFDKSMDVIT